MELEERLIDLRLEKNLIMFKQLKKLKKVEQSYFFQKQIFLENIQNHLKINLLY